MKSLTLARVEASQLQVLSHRRDIKEHIDAALASISTGNTVTAEHHLLSIQKSFQGIEEYLSATINAIQYATQRQPNSTMARKVFAVPEPLENVLQNLEVEDLMRCYGVNRTFRDMLDSSKKLQTCLFLRPTPAPEGQHEDFPLDTDIFDPLGFAIIGSTERRANVTMEVKVGQKWTIGSRWKKMHVRQPPVYSMQCRCYCYAGPDAPPCDLQRRRDKRTLRSDEGLTIGDIFEAAQGMLEMHDECSGGDNTPRKARLDFRGPVEEASLF